ncbi:MAG: hypothetical protein WC848_03050 [Parcubacteria group bacterium]|jgi:hypothetical protein
MDKDIVKIKNIGVEWWFLTGLFFIFYCVSIFFILSGWDELRSKYSAGIIMLLWGMYYVIYGVYVFSNKIELDFVNMELKESLLNIPLYTIKINEIKKLHLEFPLVNSFLGGDEFIWPNYKEVAVIEFLISGKIIRKRWYVGRENAKKIIQRLALVNEKIERENEPLGSRFFTKKRYNTWYFAVIILASIPVILFLLFLVNKYFLSR